MNKITIALLASTSLVHSYALDVNHYINTGHKLPLNEYFFDKFYLEKKYLDIETKIKKSIPINEATFISQWYYSILFLVFLIIIVNYDYL